MSNGRREGTFITKQSVGFKNTTVHTTRLRQRSSREKGEERERMCETEEKAR